MEPSFLTPPLPRAWAAPGSARGMLRSSEGGSWGPGRPAWARLVSGILPLPCFDNEVPSQLQPVSSLSPHPTASAVIDTPSHRTKRSTLLLPHCCCGQQNSLGNSQTVTKLCLASEELEGSFLSLVRHHCTSQPGLPERERTGHGSAWYSASKDEVHLLCPAPPSPCTPPPPHPPPQHLRSLLKCQAGTVGSSYANKGHWIRAFPFHQLRLHKAPGHRLEVWSRSAAGSDDERRQRPREENLAHVCN